MRLSDGLLKKIRMLLAGEALPASTLNADWVDILVEEGVLVREFQKSRQRYRISDRNAFVSALEDIDERFRNVNLLTGNMESLTGSRSLQAAETGDSKTVICRSCPGFPVNSYEPIACRLRGQEYIVAPETGTFTFISDWRNFQIPENVTVIGIENMENFRLIRDQRPFFDTLTGGGPILFVSRFPQSKDLREWLKEITNRYIHFGDFDLAGISIYETEFAVHIRSNNGEQQRCSMFIPCDIDERLRNGVKKRYDDQMPKYSSLSSPDPDVQRLIDLIHRHRRGYDQEGYILRHPIS
ncbi:MAG: hypothetical protein K2K23_09510 [Muribaculaceae bacterium]|nr:hypothetical protein [Muribaculaceae bacterium]